MQCNAIQSAHQMNIVHFSILAILNRIEKLCFYTKYTKAMCKAKYTNAAVKCLMNVFCSSGFNNILWFYLTICGNIRCVLFCDRSRVHCGL